MTHRIVVVGGGGHAKVVIETIRACGLFQIAGVVDPSPKQTEKLLGVPWLGDDETLPTLQSNGVECAAVALGDNRLREDVGNRLISIGYQLPVIAHPLAQISPTARLGQGSIVMARSCIGPCTIIGDLCIVNTGAIVEHDNNIGAAAHTAPGTTLGGCVRIGARTLVGVGASVCPGVSLGQDIIVGAGAAVICDFPDGTTVAGVPARIVRQPMPTG
jgi:UDP-perosamine 4-acetyltransferase